MSEHKGQAQEMVRTQRQLNFATAGLAAVLVGAGLSLIFVGTHASSGDVAVSGRVYNNTTGNGYGNVTIGACDQLINPAVTDTNGNFATSVRPGGGYCLRISNFPYSTAAITGPVAVANHPELGIQPSYENQVAGVNCYHNSGCPNAGPQAWDLDFDTGMNFVYTNKPTPTPPPPPAPTPAPVVVPKPVATPRPTTPRPVSTPKPAGAAPVAPTPTPTSAAPSQDTTPPTAPTNFSAMVSSSNAVVTLQWSQSSDESGIKAYQLERSFDQLTWQSLASDLTTTSYLDKTAAFGVHYYYRVQATDEAGNISDWSLADVVTSDFTINNTGDAVAYESDDHIASVQVPAGALSGQVDCSVTAAGVGSSSKKLGDASHLLVTGPYELTCKAADGTAVTDIKKPVTWTYNLTGKLSGLTKPQGYSLGADGAVTLIKSSQYDSKSHVLTFAAASDTQTLVLAIKAAGPPWAVIEIILVLLGIGSGVAIFWVRQRQRQNYSNYLRSKYYNL